jgi:hypothetical protein
MELAQDRVQWRVFVSSVLKLGVLLPVCVGVQCYTKSCVNRAL